MRFTTASFSYAHAAQRSAASMMRNTRGTPRVSQQFVRQAADALAQMIEMEVRL